jgi:hypothetical protein
MIHSCTYSGSATSAFYILEDTLFCDVLYVMLCISERAWPSVDERAWPSEHGRAWPSEHAWSSVAERAWPSVAKRGRASVAERAWPCHVEYCYC